MIWSVSTLLRRSGTPMPVWVVKDSMGCSWSEGSRVSRSRAQAAGSRSDGEDRVPRTAVAAATTGETRWVRPPLPCRPSKLRLEVEAALSPGCSCSMCLGMNPDQLQPGERAAHRAAGLAPFGTEVQEDLVQALLL